MRSQGLQREFPHDLENSRRTRVAVLAAQVPTLDGTGNTTIFSGAPSVVALVIVMIFVLSSTTFGASGVSHPFSM